MGQRITILAAAVALLIVGAAPAIAAPGGVPGPPEGRGPDKDAVIDHPSVEESNLPPWAKAYGKRIKDEFGIPFGHLQQCAGLDDGAPVDGDESAEGDEYDEGEEKPRKALEACPEDFEYPEDTRGAAAFFWAVFTEAGAVVLGT
jgi:hypothetical protein